MNYRFAQSHQDRWEFIQSLRGSSVYSFCHDGKMKVGFSRDPSHRLREWLRVYPALTVIGAARGTMKDELKVHKLLDSCRIRGVEMFVVSIANLVQAFEAAGLDLRVAAGIDPRSEALDPEIDARMKFLFAQYERLPSASVVAKHVKPESIEAFRYHAAWIRYFAHVLRRNHEAAA